MTQGLSANRLRLRSFLFVLFVAIATALAPEVTLAQRAQQISTRYFTINYPPGEEKVAKWYASFVDDVDASVSELLGAQPVESLTLTIYATEAEYTQANPMAEIHPGILAHSIPERKEIGVAVERLRIEAPGLARETFRHEMTHVIAGALSGQNLPVGFQEGLAQYNELSASRGEEVVRALQDAQSVGESLARFDFGQAPNLAQQAGASFGALGDEARMAEANSVLQEVWNWQQYGGLAAVGVGGLSVLGAALLVMRARRRRSANVSTSSRSREESVSWM